LSSGDVVEGELRAESSDQRGSFFVDSGETFTSSRERRQADVCTLGRRVEVLVSHVIVWEFVVRPGHERAFEEAYGARGAWAALFAKSPEHISVELFRDVAQPRRYVTIDRWKTAEAFGEFRRAHAAEYEALDAECAAWTESESQVARSTL
jgi:heme-degrading monooxygenase HmoA